MTGNEEKNAHRHICTLMICCSNKAHVFGLLGNNKSYGKWLKSETKEIFLLVMNMAIYKRVK